MSTPSTAAASGSRTRGAGHRNRLRKNAIGVPGIVFLVVASAAPLTSMLGGLPVTLAIGNGVGAPGIWVITGIILLLFSVGYTLMSRYVTNAGAFYAYIAQGLGRPTGVGAALVALLTYNLVQAALIGLFGYFAHLTFLQRAGFDLPWQAWAYISIAVFMVLGYFNVNVSAKVLGVLMLCEIGILLAFDFAVVANGGAHGLGGGPFHPSNVFSGSLGITFIFAFATFVGFEATAIYSEEAKNPRRAVRRSTFVAVTFIAVFYAFSGWSVIEAYGGQPVVMAAQKSSGTLFFDPNTRLLGSTATEIMNWLLISSIFASILSFHNAASRYFFSLGREGFLPQALARTHPRHDSPFIANFVQAAIAIIIVGIFAAAQLDPFTALFSWMSGIVSVGILVLMGLTCVAVIAYFHRTKLERGLWGTKVAPALGAVGLGTGIYYAVVNFNVLVGTNNGIKYLWIVVFVFLLGGMAIGFRLRRTAPALYERLGHWIEEGEPATTEAQAGAGALAHPPVTD